MVNGPPCSTCGYPLRWLAPQNAWGCDRCQKMFPAQGSQPPAHPSQPHVAPQRPPSYVPTPAPAQPYSPFPQAGKTQAIPESTRPIKKKTMLWLGLGGLVLAGGIVTLVLLLKKDDPPTRDAVIRQTVAALAAGDADTLVRLADAGRMFNRIADCEELEKDKDDKDEELAELRDPEKMKESWKKQAAQLARRTKGTKLTIVEIMTDMPKPLTAKPETDDEDEDEDEDEELRKLGRDKDDDDDDDKPERDKKRKVTTIRKGKKLMKGCVAKETFRTQEVKVKIKVVDGDREFTQKVEMSLQELGGRWYLGFPPRLNVGFDILTEDLESWRDQACKCKDAPCVEKLAKDIGKGLEYAEYQFDRDADVPDGALDKIRKVSEERKECEATAKGGVALAKMKEFKDRMCACKDEKCSEAVNTDMTEWTRLQAGDKYSPSSYELRKQMEPLTKEFAECSMKLLASRIRLDSVYPATGESTGGTFVTIRGRAFTTTPRTAKVYFGAVEGTFIRFNSDYEMTVQAPAGVAEQTADIMVVFDPGGMLRLPAAYTYKAPITSLPSNPKAPSACDRYRRHLEK
ncbi:MAG TPA: IPT/TIG domain-containing protein, partial [Kofleriaceae bacterium]